MGNTKHVGTKMMTDPTTKMQILETKVIDVPTLCRGCKKENRENGSSKCKDCSIRWKEHIASQERLSRKIAEQAKLVV